MAYCANCGLEISDQAIACPKCGQPGGGSQTVSTDTSLASWGQRVGAALIDGLVVGVPSWILMAIFGIGAAASGQVEVDPITGEVVGGGGALFLMMAVVFAVGVLYRVLLEGGRRGQTVGKMALRIQVRDATAGGSIGYGRAFLRWVVAGALWIVTVPGIIDVLFPLWDKRRQTLHDKAARSIVVRVA
ncbi:MAG: RDD family protein [Actinomycetota bacterium]